MPSEPGWDFFPSAGRTAGLGEHWWVEVQRTGEEQAKE